MASVASGGEATPWQPKDEGLREICGLLDQQVAPTSDDKSMIWQHYSQFPDFNNYLAFIFARAEETIAILVDSSWLWWWIFRYVFWLLWWIFCRMHFDSKAKELPVY